MLCMLSWRFRRNLSPAIVELSLHREEEKIDRANVGKRRQKRERD